MFCFLNTFWSKLNLVEDEKTFYTNKEQAYDYMVKLRCAFTFQFLRKPKEAFWQFQHKTREHI